MKILDPHLKDGLHEWRDGRRFFKEGDKLYLEGTTTLAGRFVFSENSYIPLVTVLISSSTTVLSQWINVFGTLRALLGVLLEKLSDVLR